jgi:putative pyrroloquinoline-quinone binding quinoprotein
VIPYLRRARRIAQRLRTRKAVGLAPRLEPGEIPGYTPLPANRPAPPLGDPVVPNVPCLPRLILLLLPATGSLLLPCQAWGQTGQEFPTPSRGRRGDLSPTPIAAPLRPVKTSHFTEAWRAPLEAPLSGALLGSPQQIVATLDSGTVVALSPQEGRTLWKQELGGAPVGGTLFLGSGIAQAGADGRVAAWSMAGEPMWASDLKEPISRPPTGSLEEMFIPLASSKLVSLGADGHERWRVDLRAAPSAPPAACRGFVAVGTQGGIEAFARGTGKPLWAANTGSEVVSPLLCYRGAIYFGTADGRLWALKYSGRKMWRFPAGARCAARPFGSEGRVYYPSYDNYLYALKARSGHLILRVKLSHRLADNVLVGRDRIYLSPYTSARLTSLSLPDLILAGEYRLDLEGDWFTTSPIRIADSLYIGYGRYEGRILALRETQEEAEAKTP